MYVDAYLDRRNDKVKVAERINGKRIMRDLHPTYEFYTTDPRGITPSVTGEMTQKHTFHTSKDMKNALDEYKSMRVETFESDVNVLFKTLATNYMNEDAPELNVAFFDIETDFCKKRGYAPVNDPFNRVTAVSMYLTWSDRLIMLVLKPESMEQTVAEEIVSRFDDKEGEVILCHNEVQMLNMFLDLIDDADVMSGWNSEFYDVPYLVNRIKMVMSEAATARFCLWNQKPRARKAENYGKEIETFDFVGRIHLDYLQLYKKHSYQIEQSYSLDYIGGKVTGEHKVPYDGNLDQLYNEEFEQFIDYGLQDSKLLKLINDKKDFINLHNRLAHQECVPIPSTMGSVALLETAVINEIHSWGEVVFDKKEKPASDGAAGAWVQDPIKGLHDYIGLIDLNSLYPSVIRSLKMSTESIVGQVRQTYTDALITARVDEQRAKSKSKAFKPNYTDAWHNLFAAIEHTKVHERSPDAITVDMEDGSTFETTGAELHDIVYAENSTLVLSANGTLFDRNKKGVIPSILTRWYTERQLMQRAVMDCKQLSGKSSIDTENGYTTEEMDVELNGYTRRSWLAENEPDMVLEQREDGKWYAVDAKAAKTRGAYWKMMQQIRKILLNSLYGALLNKHCRFYDKRLGQSVTLTGRSVTKHMASKINEVLVGEYKETDGVIIYGDTDSVMFSAKKHFEESGVDFEWNKENCADLYLAVAEKVSESFPEFMHKAFNTGLTNGRIIDAGLEIAGSRGLFLKKKRYGILKFWEDGFRKDVDGLPGELKAMGVEIKRSDTPKFIQNFLEDVFIRLLDGGQEDELRNVVVEFKRKFKELDPWQKGSPKAVKNLTNKTAEYERTGKCGVGHVLAAINWNNLRAKNGDVVSDEVVDGGKTIVCKLLENNPLGIKSIGYPIENADNLPQWFKDLPFDVPAMEQSVLTQKLDNLFGTLDMDLAIHDNMNTTLDSDMFSW